MKTAIFWPKSLLLMVILAISALVNAQHREMSNSLKIINWDDPTMDISAINNFTAADIALVDVENMANNPELLQLIKKANPKIILIAKVNLSEIVLPTINRPIETQFIMQLGSLEKEFLLRDSAGRKVVAPREGGGYIFNISADCPRASNGLKYNEFLANFFAQNVFYYPIWDGIYVRASWESIFSLAAESDGYTEIDANKDGLGDEKFRFIMAWKKGFDDFIDTIASTKKTPFIVFNRIKFVDEPRRAVASHQ
jgi:hypothetical protein